MFHRTGAWQRVSCTLESHQVLTNVTIPQDDGIEYVATLHASPCGTFQLAAAVEQVYGDFVHQKTAASQAG
jgi:hypothetical protein